jgi:iron complex transport system substrate-binding protein
MRICSLLPSATEILYALGAGDEIIAVSHECDYPPAARQKPHAIRTVIDQDAASSAAIDHAVRQAIEQGQSLYAVDGPLLRRLAPDLVVTQELCAVCAIDTSQVLGVLRTLPANPAVLSLHPHTLEDVFAEIRLLGERTGRVSTAERLVERCRARLAALQARLQAATHRPRVWCVEWLAPSMAPGHWVPEQVALAGGIEVLGRAGAPSRYVTDEEILAAQPEVLVVMPCGFPIARTRRELSVLTSQPWWNRLPAVQQGRVFLVDGPAYFNRSGLRLIDGIELLASLFHPERCSFDGEGVACAI